MDKDLELVTANEVRVDFAQRLKRRLEAMSQGSLIQPQCDPDTVWERAARVVDLVLAECNGEEEEEAVR